jgi:hypothetical protein
MPGQPHHVNWKTVGVVLGFAGAIFAGGMAYQRLGNLEEEMRYVRSRVDAIYNSMPSASPAIQPQDCDDCKTAVR